jgi:hypothetical protein
VTLFILGLVALTASTIAAILWLVGRWERSRPSNEELPPTEQQKREDKESDWP